MILFNLYFYATNCWLKARKLSIDFLIYLSRQIFVYLIPRISLEILRSNYAFL